MNLLWMLLAFFIMSGAALLYCSLLKVNIGEGTLLSASSIVGILFLSGVLAGTFRFGMYGIFALSLAGYILWIVCRARGGARAEAFWKSPYFITLLGLFTLSVILYVGSFIQRIDEFHQWAMAVKYMFYSDELPFHTTLVNTSHPFGTSLFYLFFQKITGFSEPNMYSSSFLLMWIGFLLPFSDYKKRDWKKIAVYAAVLYVSIYSLYTYGAKNLYVDLQTAAWAGGLAGWWINREKKKTNLPVAAAGLLMLCFFKMLAGPLMAVFVILFMLTQTFLVEKGILDDQKRRKKVFRITAVVLGACFVAVCAAAVWAIKANMREVLPDSVVQWCQALEIDREKIVQTINAFVTKIAGGAVANYSNLKIAFLPFLVLLAVLCRIAADMYGQKKKQIVYTGYMLTTALLYCGILLMAFIFIFSYEESVKVAGSVRYLAVYMIYMFVIVLVWLLQRKKAIVPKVKEYVLIVMLLVFIYGVNSSFIPSMTGRNQQEISRYSEIVNARSQAEKINTIITENDKVYFLDQQDESDDAAADYAGAVSIYYLGENVGNYHSVPWKFTENGCWIRVADFETPKIEDFPSILSEGGYTYVWIYKTDGYLNEHLPELLDCGEIASGRLYRIVYENGMPVGLELAADLTEAADEEGA